MSRFRWQSAVKRHLPDLRRFITLQEHWCAPFGANLASRHPLARHRMLFCTDGIDIIAAVQISYSGNVIPVLSEAYLRESSNIPQPRLPVIPKPFSIMGKADWVEQVCMWYNTTGSTMVDYYLMAGGSTPPPVLPIPGVTVLKVGPKDADRLYPLQRGYETEEVILHPDSFNEKVCRAHLGRLLTEQEVFAASTVEGVALAKANTNALGITCEQIGGVYTLPDFRGQGIGSLVVSVLLDSILCRRKTPCLFVKKDNTPAVTPYRHRGLDILGSFVIVYPEGKLVL